MIIDSHSHYIPPEIAINTTFFKVNWSDIDRHLSTMDDLGIERSVLLYPTTDAHLHMGGWKKVCEVYNSAIFNIVEKHPDRFIGAGIIPIDSPELFLGELSKIKDLGFKIISLASSYEGRYLDDEIFYPIFDFAKENGFLIHVHPQIMNPIGTERLQDPLLTPVLEYMFDVSACIGKMMMNGVFLKYPEVKFIFAHYGGALPLLKDRFDNTYKMLRGRNFVKDIKNSPSFYFKNLYFDTSGSKSFGSLQCALEITDVSHIFFGSDFPANQSISESIGFMKDGGIPEEDIKKICSENFLKVLK